QPQQFFAPTARSSTSGFQHRLLPTRHCSSRTWLRRYDLLAAARGRQCPLGEEPAPREELVRGNAMAASYQGTVMPGSNVSSTIRTFSDAVQRRRRLTDVIISTRSAGLVIDTVVCHLPSGRPGPVGSGAVSSRSPNSADRGQTFKRLAHYLICIKSDLVPWVWR